MSSYSYSDHPPEPREALREAALVGERIRGRRWWFVAESLVMAASLTVFYIAIHAWPDLVDTWFLTGLIVVVGLLVLLQRHRKSLPTPAQRWQDRTLWISLGLVLVCLPLYRFLLPQGFSLWLVLAGLLPGVPYVVLAFRVSRS